VSDPYEEPLNPEVLIESDKETPEQSADKIIAKLEELGYLPPVPKQDVYSEEEEAKIKKRLEDLGYL